MLRCPPQNILFLNPPWAPKQPFSNVFEMMKWCEFMYPKWLNGQILLKDNILNTELIFHKIIEPQSFELIDLIICESFIMTVLWCCCAKAGTVCETWRVGSYLPESLLFLSKVSFFLQLHQQSVQAVIAELLLMVYCAQCPEYNWRMEPVLWLTGLMDN